MSSQEEDNSFCGAHGPVRPRPSLQTVVNPFNTTNFCYHLHWDHSEPDIQFVVEINKRSRRALRL